MPTSLRQLRVALCASLAFLGASACTGSPQATASVAADSAPPTSPPEEPLVSPPLPAAELGAIVDGLPAALDVPGVIVAVSRGGERWVGTAGVDDTEAGTPMRPEGRFRAASITKLFTAAVILGMVEDGDLSLDDTLDHWFPEFPNAGEITIRMLLSHTAGVTSDWWEHPDLAQLALDDLSRIWTPAEVLDVTAQHPPAGPPGGAPLYSNTGYILLGEIAADIGNALIGELIEHRIVGPLKLRNTSYQFDPPPDLLHGYFEFEGITLDTTTTPVPELPSMAGAAGAIHTNATDLLTFLDALAGSDRPLDPATVAVMQSTDDTGNRWGLAFMGYCPCTGSGPETTYSGWGHTGHLPGHYSVVVHFAHLDASVVAFINNDTVDGQPVDHTFLDATVEQIAHQVALHPAPDQEAHR
jgi:D-alanyl-D-alanine carboxypeptidase